MHGGISLLMKRPSRASMVESSYGRFCLSDFPICSVESLAKQTRVKYGVLAGGILALPAEQSVGIPANVALHGGPEPDGIRIQLSGGDRIG